MTRCACNGRLGDELPDEERPEVPSPAGLPRFAAADDSRPAAGGRIVRAQCADHRPRGPGAHDPGRAETRVGSHGRKGDPVASVEAGLGFRLAEEPAETRWIVRGRLQDHRGPHGAGSETRLRADQLPSLLDEQDRCHDHRAGHHEHSDGDGQVRRSVRHGSFHLRGVDRAEQVGSVRDPPLSRGQYVFLRGDESGSRGRSPLRIFRLCLAERALRAHDQRAQRPVYRLPLLAAVQIEFDARSGESPAGYRSLRCFRR